MNQENSDIPKPTRIAKMEEATIAGISSQLTSEAATNIPEMWNQFNAQVQDIPSAKSSVAYGLCSRVNNGMEYMCGVEVSEEAELAKGWSYKKLPAQKYAVFAHEGHVSTLRNTIDAIWNKAIPISNQNVAEGAGYFFERYGEEFDPQKGEGGIEIWIPIK